MMSCLICCDDYNKSTKCEVICIYCNFAACRSCCQKYILDQRIAKCMNNNCDKEWTRRFLKDNFTKIFVNKTWKEVKEDLLFDKEKALLPATQPIVEQKIENKRLKQEMNDLLRVIYELERNREVLQRKINRKSNVISVEKRQFIRTCPAERCRGYLSTNWKCGVCGIYACMDCHQIKEEGHICDQNDVETAKFLIKDTKNCPKCSVSIHKISGCDQMWCTQCHTAFSWKTGAIETSIHNPHFYEWRRRNGEVQLNMDEYVCGELLDHNTSIIIDRLIVSKLKESPKNVHTDTKMLLRRLGRVIQSTLHLRIVQLPRYRVDHVENNLDYRIAYLMDEIDTKTFKINVQRANKKHEKKREIYEVIDLYVRTITEIVFRIADYVKNFEDVNTDHEKAIFLINVSNILDETLGIKKYANECLEEIASTYGSKRLAIRIYGKLESDVYRGPREVLYSPPIQTKKSVIEKVEKNT